MSTIMKILGPKGPVFSPFLEFSMLPISGVHCFQWLGSLLSLISKTRNAYLRLVDWTHSHLRAYMMKELIGLPTNLCTDLQHLTRLNYLNRLTYLLHLVK